jgi:hypothetical protein
MYVRQRKGDRGPVSLIIGSRNGLLNAYGSSWETAWSSNVPTKYITPSQAEAQNVTPYVASISLTLRLIYLYTITKYFFFFFLVRCKLTLTALLDELEWKRQEATASESRPNNDGLCIESKAQNEGGRREAKYIQTFRRWHYILTISSWC